MSTAWTRQVVIAEADAEDGVTGERLRTARLILSEVDGFLASYVLTAAEEQNLGDEEEMRELLYEGLAGNWFGKGKTADGTPRVRRYNRALAEKYIGLLGMGRSGKLDFKDGGGLPEKILGESNIPKCLEEVLAARCGYKR
jgi:hypothetical protein